jgi:transcription elongation factor Elf1
MTTNSASQVPVSTFDHTEISSLPEYWEASRAIDKLAHAIIKSNDGMPQTKFLEIIRQMTESLPYSDECQRCGRELRSQADSDHYSPPIFAPRAANVDGNSLRGSYKCPNCGDSWTCGYDVRLPYLL